MPLLWPLETETHPIPSHLCLYLWGTELEPAPVTLVCVHALCDSEAAYVPHTQRAHNPTHSAIPLAHSLKAWNLQTGILDAREGGATEQQIVDPEMNIGLSGETLEDQDGGCMR